MTKRLLILFVLVAMAATGIAFAGGKSESGAAQVTKMRLSCNNPPGNPPTMGYEFMAGRIKELTNGAIDIGVFPSGMLGSEREVVEQVRAGAVEIVHVSAGFLGAFVPSVDVFNVPYLFRSHDHYWKVMTGPVGARIAADIDKYGAKLLVWVEGGSRSFYNNTRPITKPEDLVGLKIRVMGSPVMIQTMKALGANPTTTAYAEVYNALQTKVIDGAENSPTSVASMKHNEVAKYFSLNEHMKIPDLLIMGNVSWNKLSEKDKDIFKKAAAEAQEFIKKEWNRQESINLDACRKTMIINEIPDKSAFIEAAKPLHQELAAKFGDLIEQIKAVQ